MATPTLHLLSECFFYLYQVVWFSFAWRNGEKEKGRPHQDGMVAHGLLRVALDGDKIWENCEKLALLTVLWQQSFCYGPPGRMQQDSLTDYNKQNPPRICPTKAKSMPDPWAQAATFSCNRLRNIFRVHRVGHCQLHSMGS